METLRQKSLRKMLGRNGLLETEAYGEIGVNRDDIVRMAQESNFGGSRTSPKVDVYWQQFERFAALVAAAEREECAKIAEKADAISGLRSALSIRLRGKE